MNPLIVPIASTFLAETTSIGKFSKTSVTRDANKLTGST